MVHSFICDFLIRLKNATLAGNEKTSMPHSKYIENVSKLLKEFSYISDYSVEGDVKKTLTIVKPNVHEVKLYSTPGRKLYSKTSSLPWGESKDSLIILSTSSGVMSQKQASKKKLGGLLVAQLN